jgi:hypothetical protein
MPWLWASLLIRSAVILVGAEILRRFPRKLGPADRHRILFAAFGLLLISPLFSAVVPEIHVPLWPHLSPRDTVTIQQTKLILTRDAPPRSTFNWPLVIWMAGVLLTLAPAMFGYLNVLRMARRAIPLMTPGTSFITRYTCN